MSSYDRPAPFEEDDSLDKTGGVGQAHVEPAYTYGYHEERNVKGGKGEGGYSRDENAMDKAGIIEKMTTHRGLKSRHSRIRSARSLSFCQRKEGDSGV
jgi:hypothetical protein